MGLNSANLSLSSFNPKLLSPKQVAKGKKVLPKDRATLKTTVNAAQKVHQPLAPFHSNTLQGSLLFVDSASHGNRIKVSSVSQPNSLLKAEMGD